MCDYSLSYHESRPAAVGDRLESYRFYSGTGGFVEADANNDVAVCLLPGTEVRFEKRVTVGWRWWPQRRRAKVARFRQVDVENLFTHHDALEFPDGELVKLTRLTPGQRATVLQLPVVPRETIGERGYEAAWPEVERCALDRAGEFSPIS